jgi:hypothetical protein
LYLDTLYKNVNLILASVLYVHETQPRIKESVSILNVREQVLGGTFRPKREVEQMTGGNFVMRSFVVSDPLLGSNKGNEMG